MPGEHQIAQCREPVEVGGERRGRKLPTFEHGEAIGRLKEVWDSRSRRHRVVTHTRGELEIDERDLVAVPIEEDVLGVDVPVDDPGRMQGLVDAQDAHEHVAQAQQVALWIAVRRP